MVEIVQYVKRHSGTPWSQNLSTENPRKNPFGSCSCISCCASIHQIKKTHICKIGYKNLDATFKNWRWQSERAKAPPWQHFVFHLKAKREPDIIDEATNLQTLSAEGGGSWSSTPSAQVQGSGEISRWRWKCKRSTDAEPTWGGQRICLGELHL